MFWDKFVSVYECVFGTFVHVYVRLCMCVWLCVCVCGCARREGYNECRV
jgi:hypothetical protein